MSTPFAVTYRPATRDDYRFVFDSWRRSAVSLPTYAWAPPRLGDDSLRIALQILAPQLTIEMAVNPDDEEQIFGWLARSGGIAHYAYVKAPWRRAGLGAELYRRSQCHAYSHVPRTHPRWLIGTYAPTAFWTDHLIDKVVEVRIKIERNKP